MPRKGENIYKRKDGRWEGRYIKGYRFSDKKAQYGYVYARSYTEVKEKMRMLQRSGQEYKGNATPIFFGNIAMEWLFVAQNRVKESTFARYYQMVESHIVPEIGNYPTEKINTVLIEEYITQLLFSGRLDGKGGLSSKTVWDILTIIKSIIIYARENGISINCDLRKITIKKNVRPIQVLTPSDQKKLTAFLLQDMDNSKFGVLLSLYTGIRLGEVCALQWENINFETGVLEVRKTLQRMRDFSAYSYEKTKLVLSDPKTNNSIRDIPLPDNILAIAAKLRGSQETYLLTNSIHYMEPRTLQNRYKRYLAECDIPENNYHTLRHTFATRCIEVGFEIKSLSEILGHASVNITLNRYVHSSYNLKKANMQKVTQLFEQ